MTLIIKDGWNNITFNVDLRLEQQTLHGFKFVVQVVVLFTVTTYTKPIVRDISMHQAAREELTNLSIG